MSFDTVVNTILAQLPNFSAMILLVIVLLREMRIKDARILALEKQIENQTGLIIEQARTGIFKPSTSSGLD